MKSMRRDELLVTIERLTSDREALLSLCVYYSDHTKSWHAAAPMGVANNPGDVTGGWVSREDAVAALIAKGKTLRSGQ